MEITSFRILLAASFLLVSSSIGPSENVFAMDGEDSYHHPTTDINDRPPKDDILYRGYDLEELPKIEMESDPKKLHEKEEEETPYYEYHPIDEEYEKDGR